MKKEKSCGAVVYKKENDEVKILLIKHQNGGHWAFPKGHVEKNETEEETAIREISEETSLSVRLDSGFRETVTYSPKPDIKKDVIYFAAEFEAGSVQRQEDEVIDIKWVKLSEADTLITYENDKGILWKFSEYLSNSKS